MRAFGGLGAVDWVGLLGFGPGCDVCIRAPVTLANCLDGLSINQSHTAHPTSINTTSTRTYTQALHSATTTHSTMPPKSGSAELLAALRAAMAAQGLAALVVPSEGTCVRALANTCVGGMCTYAFEASGGRPPAKAAMHINADPPTPACIRRRAPVGVHPRAGPAPRVREWLHRERRHG